jgi:hypothetical protein
LCPGSGKLKQIPLVVAILTGNAAALSIQDDVF